MTPSDLDPINIKNLLLTSKSIDLIGSSSYSLIVKNGFGFYLNCSINICGESKF